MFIDKEMKFSSGQALTETAASENYINLGGKGDEYGNELYIVVRVGTALAATAGAATLTVDVQTADDSAFTTNLQTIATPVQALAKASLTANTVIAKVAMPKGKRKFMRLYYTAGTNNFSSGTIDAFVTPDVQQAFPA